ncbi:MAG: hypothetical protein V1928_03005 [Parcubacteria group bacterium]
MTLSKRQAEIKALRDELKCTNFVCERKKYEKIQTRIKNLEAGEWKLLEQHAQIRGAPLRKAQEDLRVLYKKILSRKADSAVLVELQSLVRKLTFDKTLKQGAKS